MTLTTLAIASQTYYRLNEILKRSSTICMHSYTIILSFLYTFPYHLHIQYLPNKSVFRTHRSTHPLVLQPDSPRAGRGEGKGSESIGLDECIGDNRAISASLHISGPFVGECKNRDVAAIGMPSIDKY